MSRDRARRDGGVNVRRFLRPIWYLGNNRVSQVGVMLTTASVITIGTFFTTSFFGVPLSPYVGVLAVLVLPAIFLVGLLLIPLGIWLRHRREHRAGTLPVEYPPIALPCGQCHLHANGFFPQ